MLPPYLLSPSRCLHAALMRLVPQRVSCVGRVWPRSRRREGVSDWSLELFQPFLNSHLGHPAGQPPGAHGQCWSSSHRQAEDPGGAVTQIANPGRISPGGGDDVTVMRIRYAAPAMGSGTSPRSTVSARLGRRDEPKSTPRSSRAQSAEPSHPLRGTPGCTMARSRSFTSAPGAWYPDGASVQARVARRGKKPFMVSSEPLPPTTTHQAAVSPSAGPPSLSSTSAAKTNAPSSGRARERSSEPNPCRNEGAGSI